jgi:hypothetical protein
MKLTPGQLRRIIAEEVNKVLAEVTAETTEVKCDPRSVKVLSDGSFTFMAGGQELTCMPEKMGLGFVEEAMHVCAEKQGLVLDPDSCEKTAAAAVDAMMGEPDDFYDPREAEFIAKHGRGPFRLATSCTNTVA